MYLLDTTHCLQLILGIPKIREEFESWDESLIATCVIVEGELLFGAYKSERLVANLSKIEDFLKNIRVYPIDSRTASIYAEMKGIIIDRFGPKERSKRRNIKTESLGFKDNDLWIASVAIQYKMTLISSDSDFR